MKLTNVIKIRISNAYKKKLYQCNFNLKNIYNDNLFEMFIHNNFKKVKYFENFMIILI